MNPLQDPYTQSDTEGEWVIYSAGWLIIDDGDKYSDPRTRTLPKWSFMFLVISFSTSRPQSPMESPFGQPQDRWLNIYSEEEVGPNNETKKYKGT